MISINAIFCLAMQNDDNKKTISTLFKLAYEHKPAEAKKQKEFYEQYLNNFNQHTNELYDAILLPKTDCNKTDTIRHIRTTIVTNDLIPLKQKIYNLLNCIERYNLYHDNYDRQNRNNPPPRIYIIDSVISSLKDCTIPLHEKKVENYQFLINHIAYFSVNKNNQHTPSIFEALQSISNDAEFIQDLETLLNKETLNEKQLEKWKK